ncbi:Protein-tyrosine phosphatase-like [Phytophthora cactorum]|nr:Protein-tyrosine phosphatase-like [Phytophthora cactorum]
MEEVDALLEGIYARAAEIQQAQDSESELRLLLAPVRALFVQQQRRESASSAGSSSNSSGDSRPLSYISGAAAKLHKMVVRSPPSQRLSTPRKSVNPQTLHALVTGNKTLSANTLRGKQQQSEAAIRIQALVRGKTQRQTLTRQHSLMVQGTKVLNKYVLKTDRFPNCHELDTLHGDIAPNFRRLEGTPLYGSAQPSLEGIQMILSQVAADGFTKVVWVNLREEAVIYVNGRPFTARRSAMLNENDLVPGITGHKIQVLESSMKTSLQEELKASDNRFEENELIVDTAEPDHVLTLPELYESAEVAKHKDSIQNLYQVQTRLKYGREAKRWVDTAIDECATICNIRTVIHEYRDLSNAEAKPAKRSYYLHHAMSFLERYFYLIWLQQHPNLFRLLDDLGGVRYKSDKVLADCVLKMDHFFGIARIPFELTTNVPNYRRIGNEPIFGTAQCLEQGIVDVVDHLRGEFDLPGIEVDEITAIERQVKLELQAKVRKDNGLFMYWYEPREMVNDETMEHINPQSDVKTLTKTAPEEKDLDDMVRLLLPAYMNELGLQFLSDEPNSAQKKQKTAVICNCQMGRGRTTTALVCVYMLRVVLEDSAGTGHRRHSAAITADFVVIRKLLKTLDNGSDCKLLVDYAIDQCEHMQNLRDCISQCRDLAVDRDLPSSKRDFFMLRAVNYLERYFYLVCFASYLLEEREHYFQRSLFVTWMNERYGSALYELLDNLCFEEEIGAETHVSSMRWRWRRKRKLVSRLE